MGGYYRRKFVWEKVAELVLGGWTANTAIGKICKVYGVNHSVSMIINQMKKDHATGGHPQFQIAYC